LKLTPQFLELKFIEAIADNTKNFFGDKVLISLSSSPSHMHARTHALVHTRPPCLHLHTHTNLTWHILSFLQVPNMVPDQRLLGNFLQRMFGEMAKIVNLEEVSRERSEI
jgi:hypothetical protein